MTDAPLACRLNDPAQVQERRTLIEELGRAAQETRELLHVLGPEGTKDFIRGEGESAAAGRGTGGVR